jgi:hypothetical protein
VCGRRRTSADTAHRQYSLSVGTFSSSRAHARIASIASCSVNAGPSSTSSASPCGAAGSRAASSAARQLPPSHEITGLRGGQPQSLCSRCSRS